jgi:polyvinyl alcohol dehydrogenase (cytochrome)
MPALPPVRTLLASLTALSLGACVLLLTAQDNTTTAEWLVAGHDLANSRSQPLEHKINSQNAESLRTAWVFTGGASIAATPIVTQDAIYITDWSGKLYAIRPNDGSLLWSHDISDYDRFPGAISRVSPAVYNDTLILGDLESTRTHNGANVIAVDRQTGMLRWITSVDQHPAAVITGASVVAGDMVFVGVSSLEETLAAGHAYPCCSFRGSLVALNAQTGKILWQTFTVPDNGGQPDGYSGGAIWQPPAVDLVSGSLYVGTGNNYQVPEAVENCIATSPENQQTACFAPDDHYDSALSIDINTGQIKWSTRLQGADVWTLACEANLNPVECPLPHGPDYDLGGSGPNLLPNLDLVGFGQKSGIYWALKPETGDIVWSSVVGPGDSPTGGILWGTATDGQQIYAAIANEHHASYPLIDGTTTKGGAWSALDAATGKILWQTADPKNAVPRGALSVANGVLYAPSFSGNMHALDAATGKILWTFASGGSVLDGPSIVNGRVYWGSGYQGITGGIHNNKLYAFTLP